MDAKYYTPTIEELCVGFEYERTDDLINWSLCISDGYDFKDVATMFNYEYFIKISHDEVMINSQKGSLLLNEEYYNNTVKKVKSSRIRVKHLDRQDIESLGWKFLHSKSFILNYRYTLKIRENILEIMDGAYIGPRALFLGEIKNKSELKKLMQQLNIKTD